MFRSRFNVVYVALLMLAGLCALVLPKEYANKVRGHIDILFAPVAAPLRNLSKSVSDRLPKTEAPGAADLKSYPAAARLEIERLRIENTSLIVQLGQLRKLYDERDLAGEIGSFSVPCRVVGGPQGLRGSLSLYTSGGDELAVRMPVVHRNGLVGRLTSVGPGAAQVQLITDHASRIVGAFGRSLPGSPITILKTFPPLVEGDDKGMLAITNLTMQQVAVLQPGDWVVLADDDWSPLVKGYYLGSIEKIEPQLKAPLHASITVRPQVSLGQLREVMVVTGRQTPAPAAPSQTAKKIETPAAPRRPKGK